jgi:hypothetical protein
MKKTARMGGFFLGEMQAVCRSIPHTEKPAWVVHGPMDQADRYSIEMRAA